MITFLYAFVLGTFFGSFASVLGYRLPMKQPIGWTRSKCRNCNQTLGFITLLPIISYILQKGKCKYCHSKICISYPFIEIFCGLLFLFICLKSGFNITGFIWTATFFSLFVASYLDIRTFEVPLKFQAILIFLAFWYGYENGFDKNELLINPLLIYFSGLILKFSYYFIRKRDGLGMADINLAFIVTIFIGIENFPYFLLLSGLLGTIFGLIWQKLYKQDIFPFFPSLSIAFLISYGIL
ncbi:MAG: prepilin peptidase [Rickettsiales bacterium]|nr:prepilin peptidase [Rickettsiales bacterium]